MDASSKKQDAGKLKQSAGILAYRKTGNKWEVLLGHPGGPFWKNKESGAWTIPKGEPAKDEELLDAAVREFREETGWELKMKEPEVLMPVKQKAGKWIHAWMVAASRPAGELFSNQFEMEWPPRSGRRQAFPEIDRFEWMTIGAAIEKINPAQRGFLEELEKKLVDS